MVQIEGNHQVRLQYVTDMCNCPILQLIQHSYLFNYFNLPFTQWYRYHALIKSSHFLIIWISWFISISLSHLALSRLPWKWSLQVTRPIRFLHPAISFLVSFFLFSSFSIFHGFIACRRFTTCRSQIQDSITDATHPQQHPCEPGEPGSLPDVSWEPSSIVLPYHGWRVTDCGLRILLDGSDDYGTRQTEGWFSWSIGF